ncbi:hypothetical protein F2Q69_00005437 [Brassica cretica]|uniref:Uncharacterized protein n=1 Tax=Brassica cretica TaxID=69181 RepID=A0A8S9PAA3_BRACR|nr:hypothetical protein F2Q69_00005437 [Brassica cretica]
MDDDQTRSNRTEPDRSSLHLSVRFPPTVVAAAEMTTGMDVSWRFSGINDGNSDPSNDSRASSGSAGGDGRWMEVPKRWNMKEDENCW